MLGLTRAEFDAYRTALAAAGAQTYRRVTVLDLDHNPLQSLTDEQSGGLLSGQVRWDRRGDTQTEATVTFSDFDDKILLDPRHLIRAEMGVKADADVLWLPTFTGWVQRCTDAGYETSVTAHGKEKFGLRASKHGHAKRGERVGEVIWRMHDSIGERHSIIPDHLRDGGPKLARGISWGGGKPEKCVTLMGRRLAKRAGLQMFHDQLGRLDLRPIPDQASVSFTETDDEGDFEPYLLQPITWDEDWAELCNQVIGGGKRDLRAVWTARDGYRFSPAKLVRGGEPIELTHRFTDDTLDSRAELRERVDDMGRRLSTARSQVQITATPAPWLLAMDRLHAAKRDGRQADFWMGQGSLELDGSVMAIGWQYVTRRAKGRHRVTGHGHRQKGRRRR